MSELFIILYLLLFIFLEFLFNPAGSEKLLSCVVFNSLFPVISAISYSVNRHIGNVFLSLVYTARYSAEFAGSPENLPV